jgi:hypothetical protein
LADSFGSGIRWEKQEREKSGSLGKRTSSKSLAETSYLPDFLFSLFH